MTTTTIMTNMFAVAAKKKKNFFFFVTHNWTQWTWRPGTWRFLQWHSWTAAGGKIRWVGRQRQESLWDGWSFFHLSSKKVNISSLKKLNNHGVWNSQKKSHSTLGARRATFTFWVDKSKLKMPKNGPFWRVFENLRLAVKHSVTRQVTFNRSKNGGKCQNSKI